MEGTHPWTFTPFIVAVTTLWLCYILMIGLTLFQELVMIWFHRCGSILASMVVLEHFANLAPLDQSNLIGDDFMCAQDVKWLQTITKLPILVKGVMTAEDSTKSQTLAISLFE